MSDILQRILQYKQAEVQAAGAAVSQAELRTRAAAAAPPRAFKAALQNQWPGIIAEIKRRSPSKGEFKPGLDILAQALAYEQGGAAAISVLTDSEFFGMRPEELSLIRAAVSLPLLRKDFIIDPYQVYEARALGADALLLIVSALDDTQLRDLRELAEGLDMDVLVEVHDEPELERALASGANLIGVNSRDLRTFTTDLSVIERVARRLQALQTEVCLVAESGMSRRDELEALRPLGVQGYLIGEALLRAEDPAALLSELRGAEQHSGVEARR